MKNGIAEQRLLTMCMNWCFLHDHIFLAQLNLYDYKKLRFDLYNKLISHPQFETLVKPAYEEFKKTDGDEADFNKCQVFVFKLMDLINREDKILEDF